MITSVIAIVVYAIAWAYLLKLLLRKNTAQHDPIFLGLVFAAMLPHAVSVYSQFTPATSLEFGILQVATLFFLVMNLLVLVSCLHKPLRNLFVFLLPFSVLALLLNMLFETTSDSPTPLEPGIISHILLSMLAYSLLTIASLQALLLAYQNQRLKSKHFHGVMGIMPPLQTMESLLFDIVWAGFLFLTLSIITGVVYIDDILAQQLSHKTVFSMLSWLIYAVLLAGHQIKGWRGAAAVRWVLGGFVALMLAYFGSKFVIEVLLTR